MNALAIVIGIDAYATDRESLKGAVADAHEVALWLREAGVPAERLHLGTAPKDWSPPLPAALAGCRAFDPSIDGLDRLLIKLRREEVLRDARLFFHFSGHGAISTNPVYAAEALCLKGFEVGRWRTALELQSLLQNLRAFQAAERYVWIDGCRDAVPADTAQFGALSEAPRQDGAIPREYVLRATPFGRKAAEAGGRGLFSRELVRGLKGHGAAKRWDPALFDGAGGYGVRWLSLVQQVTDEVARLPAAQKHEQLVSRSGEAPGNDNPELATFAADRFGPETVEISVASRFGNEIEAAIVARRDQAADEERGIARPGAPVAFSLRPSGWTILASAPGCQVRPKVRAVSVYGPGVTAAFEIEPVPRQANGGPPTAPLPAPELAQPSPPRGSGGGTRGPSRLPGSRPADPEEAHAGAVEGELELTLGGQPLPEVVPMPRVTIRHDDGRLAVDPVMARHVTLPPGLYRVAVESPAGAATETTVALSPDDRETVELTVPVGPRPALVRLLGATGKPEIGEDGLALPSEAAGWLSGTTAATMAILAAARAAAGSPGGLGQLGIGAGRPRGADGVEVLVVDEAGEAVAPTRARLWAMRLTNDGIHGRLTPTPVDPAIASASLAAEPGHYWLELQDDDRQERRGFKLASRVFPGHVTLVVRQQLREGGVAILQMATPHQPEDLGTALRALARAEALQRARASGRDPQADPLVAELAEGTWFEPFSAMVAGAGLARPHLVGGEERAALLAAIVGRLDAAGIDGPDSSMLKATLGAREILFVRTQKDPAIEEALVRHALATGAAPLCDALLASLDSAARRLRLFGPEQRWIAEKRSQAVGHPLWTLRREDDKKRSGRPDAVALRGSDKGG